MDVVKSAAITAGPTYNEASVRFHIMDPLLRQLGYGGDDNTYLLLEEKLEYPYFHIGHRSRRDNPLGHPDYHAGLKGARGSFIVETKAGSTPLTLRDVEQAHSYAAHAQVGAHFFVLCNGLQIRIYETLSGPTADPIVTVPISQINERYHEIGNILSPGNLAKHCKVEYDRKLNLCEGLGSSASIRSGIYKISEYKYRFLVNGEDQTALFRTNMLQVSELDEQMEMLKNVFELKVEEGSAERDENGLITAHARIAGVTIPNAEGMRMMGIQQLSFTTSEKFLSTEADNPTMFEATKEFALAEGAMLPLLLGEYREMASDLDGNLFVKASMYFDGKEILGQYRSFAYYNVKRPSPATLKVEMDVAGSFVLRPDL